MAEARNKEVAIRKRQQIDSSRRTMFLFVAGAAFVAGIALVVSYFLAQQIWFHTKIINAKQSTISTIKQNIDMVDELKENVRVLDTNQALNSAKVKDGNSALQVILDALPAEANADALGASLQVKFVEPVGGLKVESMTVESAALTGEGENPEEETEEVEDEAATTEEGEDAEAVTESPSIAFQMSVSGSAAGLKQFLTRLERSIRVVKLDSIEVQAGDGRQTMNIIGRAYYEPARVIELGTEVIKP